MLIHNKKIINGMKQRMAVVVSWTVISLYLTPLLFNSEHELKMYYWNFHYVLWWKKKGISIYIIYKLIY